MTSAASKERFLRLPEVQKRTGFSRSYIYKSVSDGEFPAPIKVGGRASVWLESEVIDWMNAVVNGKDPVT